MGDWKTLKPWEEQPPLMKVLGWMALLAVILLLVFLVLVRYTDWSGMKIFSRYDGSGHAPRATGQAAPNTRPAPRLMVVENADRLKYEANERKILETYGWTDQGAGRARIPIDRAMKLVVERGLPARGNEGK